jgi:uncharacterized repeat protein (TIGR03803 family)
MDGDGALYGVAAFGGTSNLGTAFQMRPPEPGKNRWKYKVLHSFSGPDGRQPFAVLAMDGAGVLFGTTWVGGASSAGTIFQLLPPAPGKSKWEHELLHSFVSTDGSGPHGGLAIGAHGTLYGTTTFGGASAIAGTIFQLRRPAAGKKIWKHTVLHDFTGGADGSQPPAGLIRDGAGVLYGTVQHGGLGSEGTVFRMLPPSTFEVLYTFTSAPPGGREPFAGLTMGPDGALYGATQAGGTSGAGTVFKLVP